MKSKIGYNFWPVDFVFVFVLFCFLNDICSMKWSVNMSNTKRMVSYNIIIIIIEIEITGKTYNGVQRGVYKRGEFRVNW